MAVSCAAIVLTLGLATGATTALFGIVDAVLLRSLPYREAERLVMLHVWMPGGPGPAGFSAPDYTGFRERATSYEAVAAFQNKTYELSGVAAPERVTGARISAELFGLLGVTPALGRDLSPEDDRGARPVVLLSDSLWARTFARDPAIVGRSIVLDRASYTVVGVMPRWWARAQLAPTPHAGGARQRPVRAVGGAARRGRPGRPQPAAPARDRAGLPARARGDDGGQPARERYPDGPSIRSFCEALLERTASLPGVRAASLRRDLEHPLDADRRDRGGHQAGAVEPAHDRADVAAVAPGRRSQNGTACRPRACSRGCCRACCSR